ncbi:hypothetical protein HQQ80_09630 [Microbacteriaceae bacterium VKM Ac-2855]|nr:hypothetical protein [Microbacteriaceae bacterium VKM Ac-2855]
MPSYRVVVTIGSLAAGVDPAAVVPAAGEAAAAFTTLESGGIAVVRGEPRITIRFTGIDDAEAGEVSTAVIDTVRTMAAIERAQILRLTRGRWVRLHDLLG